MKNRTLLEQKIYNIVNEAVRTAFNEGRGLQSDKENQKKALDDVKKKHQTAENDVKETKDRSEYWKQRWAKQKADGTVPDRSEYWKTRAKKEKEEKLTKLKTQKHNKMQYPKSFEKDYDEFDDVLDLMTDNDWGEYFGDHRD